MPSNLENLVPVKFVKVGGHDLVELVDARLIDLSPGFFHQALENVESPRSAFRIMPLCDLRDAEQALPGGADFGHTSLIFHVSRCGSTLLCQNLKANGRCIVLGEPSFLSFDKLHQDFGDLAEAVLAQSLQAWQRWAMRQRKQLVVKMPSKACRHIARFRALLADVPVAGLTRDPLHVLESLSRNPSRFLRNRLAAADGGRDVIPCAADEYQTAVRHIVAATRAGMLQVDYDDLPDAFAKLCDHLKVRLTRPHAKWAAERSAKSRHAEDRPYQHVPASDLEAFYAAHAALIEGLRSTYKTAIQTPI